MVITDAFIFFTFIAYTNLFTMKSYCSTSLFPLLCLFFSLSSYSQWIDSGNNTADFTESQTPVVHYSDTNDQLILLRKSDPTGITYVDTLSPSINEWGLLSDQLSAIDFTPNEDGSLTFLDTVNGLFSLSTYDHQLNQLSTTSSPSLANSIAPFASPKLVHGPGINYFVHYRTNTDRHQVYHFDGNVWNDLGIIVDTNVTIKEVKIASDGSPYALYMYADNIAWQSTHFVVRYDGSQWGNVYTHTTPKSDDHSFSIAANDAVYLSTIYSDDPSAITGFRCAVDHFTSAGHTSISSNVFLTLSSAGNMASLMDRNDIFHAYSIVYELGWSSIYELAEGNQGSWYASPISGSYQGAILDLSLTTDAFNCTHVASGFIDNQFLPSPPRVIVLKSCDCIFLDTLNSVSVNQDVLTASIPNAVSYQWIDCASNQPINGATASSYTAQQNGDYAVIISNGSCVDTSACANVNTIGIDEHSALTVSIAPNPATDVIRISFPSGSTTTVTISNAMGEVVRIFEEVSANDLLEVSALPVGTYFVHLTNRSTPIPLIKLR